MEKKFFRSGEKVPYSGNYLFEGHESEVENCVPRPRVYLHLIKGMKLPLHDECLQPSQWSLMTITEEESDPRIIGM